MSDTEQEPAFRRLEPLPPLHKTVQEEIRHYIIKQDLRPGDALKPEAELARLFGVSRNSVREAVKALESTGVLETRRGSGVYIKDFSFTPLLDNLPYGLMQGRRALSELVALRKALEAGMIADAMHAITPERVAALRVVLADMGERAGRGENFADQDREFHRLLFADLGNEMLLQLFDLFWQAYHRAAPPVHGRDPRRIHALHAAIVKAVLSGDAERARDAVRQHYVGIEERVSDDRPVDQE
ncbi:FadR/GntR family transcriptional regulator [Jiangella alkaliphila]|uniref:DNA-binding transcriptional regulator, FadR family n=2 Tax=Jiangella alkaliphila TaxID=419479 RepID=A0A1H2LAP3_9ACTN|nr:FadR/GntR family transcriptional regulator [Jiangella alkaliphila]SDU78107.1 DNA-binding transcriptional regulator, FadR family [Jiangella alkaliphila]